jgi:DNA-binding MarR family transcriptional regulator
LRLLHAVAEHNGDSAAALSRVCQVTPQTLQAMLTRAVREGWIVRGRSDRSQRILTARLTPRGRAVLRRGMTMAEQIEERLWHGIPLTTLHTFDAILGSGLANLHEELSRKSRPPTTHS